ncbi:MAG: hypothetical protein ACTHLA_07265 [Asticcacaulis sp.]|uniref:hypothetical protein n=1 Tax=Asticcacaulis sp. TaxID=1872648 RepID=UPI003F7C36EC
MTEFFRRGHVRNGSWVEGHKVRRVDWNRSGGAGYIPPREGHFLPRNSDSFINPNATCRICGKKVYYFQNDYGSKVWFDSLWPHWEKHPCFYKAAGELYKNSPVEPASYDTEGESSYRQKITILVRRNFNTFFRLTEIISDHSTTTYHSTPTDMSRKNLDHFFICKHGSEIFTLDPRSLEKEHLPTTTFSARAEWLFFAKLGRENIGDIEFFKKYLKKIKILPSKDQLHIASWLYDNTKWNFKYISIFSGAPIIEIEKISNDGFPKNSPFYYKLIDEPKFEFINEIIEKGYFEYFTFLMEYPLRNTPPAQASG